MSNDNKDTKPLRTMKDKMKDIMNTYGRQEQASSGSPDTADSFESNVSAEHATAHSGKKGDSAQREIPIDEPTAAAPENSAPNDTTNEAEVPSVDVKKLLAERDELKEIAARKVAELENFRRRTEQEKKEIISFANRSLLEKVLPMIDDLGRAVENGRKTDAQSALLEGVEMIYKKALSTLEDIGVQHIEVVGQPFDVNLHEALMQQPSPEPEGIILHEVVRGYTLHGKVIRHAKVITSAGQ